MEVLLIILMSLCFILLIIVFIKIFTTKKVNVTELIKDEIKTVFESLTVHQNNTIELKDAIKNLNHTFEKKQENNFNKIEEKYKQLIKGTNEEKKTSLIRHCFNRLPASDYLLYLLWKSQKKIIENTTSTLLQRNLVIDMNNAVTLYRNNCNIEDLDKADYFYEELERISDGLLIKLRKEQRELVETQVKQLEENIEHLTNNRDNKDIIKELEKLDNSIDKELIESLPTLKARYQSCSEKLLKIFSAEDSIDDDTLEKQKEYNLKAINCHKKALNLFEEDTGFLEENNLKKGKGIEKLVELMGGWDNLYLLPSTMSYNNTIYGTIFSKLKKETQLMITKLMVKEKKKEL